MTTPFSADGGAEPQVIDVWPGTAPGEQEHSVGWTSVDANSNVTLLRDVTRPQLLLFRAPGAGPHPTVMVCPGGGYSLLALDLEGTEVARWLNSLGITAAVLQYRVPDRRDGAFADGRQALSLLRDRAAEFGIDPHRLGVLGFSAGGHLSARLAVGSLAPGEPAYLPNTRPDFAMPIYPAFLLDADKSRSAPELTPHAGMPPMFVMQTEDDCHFCAPVYIAALEQAGVPTRALLYPTGGHGYGVRLPESEPAHRWRDEAAAWLRTEV